MPSVDHAIVLPVAPEQVWQRITALPDLPQWLDGVAAVRSISTPQTQPGTRFEILRAGVPHAEPWIVLDWEPGRSLRLTEYHQDLHLRLRLEQRAEGTRLHGRYEWRAPRGLIQRFRSTAAEQQALQRSLQRLAAVLESHRA
jgi:uncharacterized protein YndB with AHSA1/START domain